MIEREKAKIWQALRQAREEEKANFEGFAKMNEGNEKVIEERAGISIYILQGISYAEQEIAKAIARQRKGRS